MKNLLMIILACLIFSSVFAAGNSGDVICPSNITQDKSIGSAVHWYHSSIEKQAIYRELYVLGLMYVKQQVQIQHLKPHSWGVIIDIDETALDNSLYYSKCNLVPNSEDDFSKYISTKEFSTAAPGLKAFVRSIKSLGGYVTFLTNRDGSYPGVLRATAENLKKEGVYFDQIVMANRKDAANPTDKNSRFAAIINGKYNAKEMVWLNKLPAHKLIAFFGDNIQDFPKLKQIDMVRAKNNGQEFEKFGDGYFLFPNPIYGSWQLR
jgi:5'-nucleotidase (lipoprotein e(P4) family)